MLITRETDYALRIIRSLAEKELVSAACISEKDLIPKQFIYKIAKKLERAGIISIRQGTRGGFLLIADLSDLSLLDVMLAVGDRVMVNACMEADYDCAWIKKRQEPCLFHKNLFEFKLRVEKELSEMKLDALCGL